MNELNKNLKEYTKKLESETKLFFKEKKKDLSMKKNYELLEKFVLNGGKRLRPISLIMAYKGYGGKKNILRESLSVEFFHNATLVLDDYMDEDELRRGKPTIYKILKDQYLKKNKEKKYNGSLFNRESCRTALTNANLLGNILYVFGSECLNKTNIECLKVYHDAYEKVNVGQIFDVSLEKNRRAKEEDYVEMAQRKSSNLVMASVEIGGILAGAKKKNIDALKKYALNTIIAFQIADDLMDFDTESKKGHELGSDIKQGKRTLTIIQAIKKSNNNQIKILGKAFGNSKANKKQILKAIDILHETGAVNYSKEFAKKKILTAKRWLKKAGLNKTSEKFFIELADFVIERKI